MNILITGINGFVGPYLKRELQLKYPTAHVFGLGRRESADKKNYSVIDLQQKGEVDEYIKEIQPDLIFHLAAQSSVAASWENPEVTIRNNVDSYTHLLEAVSKNAMDAKVILIGSGEVYGKVKKEDLPLIESHAMNPQNPYAKSRVEQEKLNVNYINERGLKIISTRSFNHFGPGQSNRFVVGSFVEQFAKMHLELQDKELHVGDLSVIRDFLDVRDVVQAYLLIAESGENGAVYNVCSGEGTSLESIIHELKRLTNVEVAILQDKERMRPSENPAIIGSHKKLQSIGNWNIDFTLQQSLKDMLDFSIKTFKENRIG